MSQQIDTENDPFLLLLTEGLRAGPGSPQWREAINRLPADGADEYRRLIEAREALASGREYRSVRAGAGFTRKVMDEIEAAAPASQPRFKLATIIAAIAAVVLLVVVGVGIYELYPRTPIENGSKALNDLATTFLPTEVIATNFDQSATPAGWKQIGSLPLTAGGGLKVGSANVAPGDYSGGGIVLADGAAAGKPIALQAVIKIDKSTDELVPQVFASTDPQFSSDRAISSQELVWQLQGLKQKVVVNGKVMLEEALHSVGPTHTIRLVLKNDLAVVECDGRHVWLGHTQFGEKPRYFGIRFIRTGQADGADVTVQSMKVLTTNQ